VLGRVKFEKVTIVTTDGRKIAISELGPAEEMPGGDHEGEGEDIALKVVRR
jgi:hypothetical protein